MAVIPELSNRIRHLVPSVSFDPDRGTCKIRDNADGQGPQIVFWDATALGRAQPNEAELLAVTAPQIVTAKSGRRHMSAVARLSASPEILLRAIVSLVVDELNILRDDVVGVTNFVWDPASIANAAGLTRSDIVVTGAAFLDAVDVMAPYSLVGIVATAYVHAANTVGVRLHNSTGAAVNLASGTWRVVVRRQQNMAPRTLAQARTAVENAINAGTVDS